MNVRNHLIEIQCGHKDINDVAQALIHTLLFYRTHGKFNYKHEGSYSIGTLGFERATCDHLDFTYVRCSSPTLVNRVNAKIQEFTEKLSELSHSGTLALEFYTKRPSRWPFNDTKIVWELWNIKIVINQNSSSAATATSEHHHYQERYSDTSARLEDVLSHKMLDIVRIVNSDKCTLPQMPTQANLDNVFDTSLNDLQPYLYNISYKIQEGAPGSHSAGQAGTSTKHPEGNIVTDSSTQSSLKKFLLGTLEL